MEALEPLSSIIGEIENRGLFYSLHPSAVDIGGLGIAVEGDVQVSGQSIRLRLIIKSTEHLPEFYLDPWDAVGSIPHVDKRGFICYLDKEGIVLDRRRYADVIEDALGRVVNILSDGIEGRNLTEFVDEFEAYWRPRCSVGMSCVFDPGDEVCRLVIATRKKHSFIARSEKDIADYFNGKSVKGNYTIQNAIYVPLEPGRAILPPDPNKDHISNAYLRDMVFGALSNDNQERLRQFLKRPKNGRTVVIKLPRFSGGASLFGFKYDTVDGVHPLYAEKSYGRIIPIGVDRLDKKYLVPRGGADVALDTKKVLVVGGGAVGGHVAFELARAGVLNLTVVDPDKVVPDNTFRHALGRQSWDDPKASALKKAIEAEIPYTKVTPIVATIEQAVKMDKIKVESFDLIILALGNPTIELWINEILRSRTDSPPVVFTWLEPLGIGGHALLVSDHHQPGCYECLYTQSDANDKVLENRTSFAEPGQRFGKALSGCGSLHTPYGSVDATQTALLAVRLGLRSLSGLESGNPLLSWKGDSTAFTSSGFKLSRRYHLSEERRDELRYAYQSPHCKVCADKQSEVS